MGFGPEPINAAMERRKVSVPRGHLRRLRKLVCGRKARERLRTVFRRVDRKIRQGRFASAQRYRKSGLPDLRTKHADLG